MSTRHRSGFTLIELLVSTTVLTLIVLVLVQITDQTASMWRYTSGKAEQFSSARDGFEALTRQIGQATLNTYYDYYDDTGKPRTVETARSFKPSKYGRQSELRFISGSMDRSNRYNGTPVPALAADPTRPRPTHGIFFHAPLGYVDDTANLGGLQGLLNCWGYYVEFDSDERHRPAFLQGLTTIAPPRWRYRLMQFMQPAEKLRTYTKPDEWFKPAVNEPGTPAAHVLAENVIALIIQPALSPADEEELETPPTVPGTALAPSYFYDSTQKNVIPALNPHHQLPPNVRVTMVAIDETSAIRLAQGDMMPDFGLADLFRTDSEGSAENYDRDLEILQTTLAEMGCSQRVFTTNVVIRGAKWSNQ